MKAPTTLRANPVATSKLALTLCAIGCAITGMVESLSIAAPPFAWSNEPSWPALSRDSTHTLGDIYLDDQRSVIAGDAAKLLAESVGVLEGHPRWALHLEAYCDDRDTEAYSLLVGEDRLHAIHEYLTQMGVPDARITTMSYGKTSPRCGEFTVSCWEEDLRVQQTFRTVAISGPLNGCLVRLKVRASNNTLPDQAQLLRPPFLQRLHLAEPLR